MKFNTVKIEQMTHYINEMNKVKLFEETYVEGNLVIQCGKLPRSIYMKSSLTKPLLEAVNKAASEVLKKEYELAQKEFKEFILELAKS